MTTKSVLVKVQFADGHINKYNWVYVYIWACIYAFDPM